MITQVLRPFDCRRARAPACRARFHFHGFHEHIVIAEPAVLLIEPFHHFGPLFGPWAKGPAISDIDASAAAILARIALVTRTAPLRPTPNPTLAASTGQNEGFDETQPRRCKFSRFRHSVTSPTSFRCLPLAQHRIPGIQ